LDINPAAIEMVKELAAKKQLSNVEVILSDCDTGLPNESVDMVLVYDVFHDLKNRDAVLEGPQGLKTRGWSVFKRPPLERRSDNFSDNKWWSVQNVA
jgi:predicted nicotinamide N-methyase